MHGREWVGGWGREDKCTLNVVTTYFWYDNTSARTPPPCACLRTECKRVCFVSNWLKWRMVAIRRSTQFMVELVTQLYLLCDRVPYISYAARIHFILRIFVLRRHAHSRLNKMNHCRLVRICMLQVCQHEMSSTCHYFLSATPINTRLQPTPD